MKKFANAFRSDRGFTLVELLTALTLLTVVLGMITSVAIFGFRSYHKIRIENDLREEGDLLVSSVITELYTFAPDRITPLGEGKRGIILERDIEDAGKREQKRIDITSAGTLRIGETTEMAVGGESPPPPTAEEEPPVPGDARTDVQAVIKPEDSFVDVECRLLNPCETGLVKVKFVLSRSYDGRDYELGMESKFGF